MHKVEYLRRALEAKRSKEPRAPDFKDSYRCL